MGKSVASLRAKAILSLLAVYGLRSGEVWRPPIKWTTLIGGKETFLVDHSKRGGVKEVSSSARCWRCDLRVHRKGQAASGDSKRIPDADPSVQSG